MHINVLHNTPESESKQFAILMVFQKYFLKKLILEETKSANDNKA